MPVQHEQLVGQGLNPRRIEIHPFHQLDKPHLEFHMRGLAAGRQLFVLGHAREAAVLRLAELLEQLGDIVEQGHHLVADGIFHRCQRHVHIFALVTTIGVAGRGVGVGIAIFTLFLFRFFLFFFLVLVILEVGILDAIPHAVDRRLVYRAAIDTRIGGFKIDNVTQRHHTIGNLVAPVQQGADGKGGFADPADHQFAASLDALGNGDLALARQQLYATHFAKIHPHRIVGAGHITVGHIASGAGFFFLALGAFLGIGSLDNIDAHLRQFRHVIVNLFGCVIALGQSGIQLIMGDIAALLAKTHKRLDGLLRGIRAGYAVRTLSWRNVCFTLLRCLDCH
ncbi:MAG: Uncharacterised protein [SAR116 cluster bacterium]|nr:MAG: Uncharacterised protein [SAR116 cluster bacterium]